MLVCTKSALFLGVFPAFVSTSVSIDHQRHYTKDYLFFLDLCGIFPYLPIHFGVTHRSHRLVGQYVLQMEDGEEFLRTMFVDEEDFNTAMTFRQDSVALALEAKVKAAKAKKQSNNFDQPQSLKSEEDLRDDSASIQLPKSEKPTSPVKIKEETQEKGAYCKCSESFQVCQSSDNPFQLSKSIVTTASCLLINL